MGSKRVHGDMADRDVLTYRIILYIITVNQHGVFMKTNNKISFFISLVLVILTAVSMTACTTKIKDPSITEENAKLNSVEIKAENNTWHTLSEEQAQQLFDMVRSFGELDKEALDVGFSGYYTVETEYDYTFKLSYTAGNFFRRKESEFNYYVGELVRYIRENGNDSDKYKANKLVSMQTLNKRTAELSDEHMALVESVFESVNEPVMTSAYRNAAAKAEELGYLAEEIAADNLMNCVAEAFDSLPMDVEEHIISGYRFTNGNVTNYMFLTDDALWARDFNARTKMTRVGRLCLKWTGANINDILSVIKS